MCLFLVPLFLETLLHVIHLIQLKNGRYDISDTLYDGTLKHFQSLTKTPHEVTFLTIDDDVVRATSKKNSKVGYPLTRIPDRKIGINVDAVGG